MNEVGTHILTVTFWLIAFIAVAYVRERSEVVAGCLFFRRSRLFCAFRSTLVPNSSLFSGSTVVA